MISYALIRAAHLRELVTLWISECDCGGPQPSPDDTKTDRHAAGCGYVRRLDASATVNAMQSPTRIEFDNLYLPDAAGHVTASGEWFGQMIYVPYFWSQAVEDGLVLVDGERKLTLLVRPADRQLFPELKQKRFVSIIVRNGEFVREEQPA